MQGQSLTPHELEVLRLVSQGLTTRDIAKKLHRSFNTIAMHRRHILKKFGVSTTPLALLIAREQQLIPDK